MEKKRVRKLNTSRYCIHCGKNHPRGLNQLCDECIAQGLGNPHLRKTLDQVTQDKSRRNYLIRTKGHQCEMCKLTEWRGQLIPLQLDHIDGNHQNNSAENLRLLCATCHTLTKTYRSNNRGSGRHARKQRQGIE